MQKKDIIFSLGLLPEVNSQKLEAVYSDLVTVNIPAPPFILPEFEYIVPGFIRGNIYLEEAVRITRELIDEAVNIPDSIYRIIDGLKYKPAIKKRMKSFLDNGDPGLWRVSGFLMMLNMKNYQPWTKDLIERMSMIVEMNLFFNVNPDLKSSDSLYIVMDFLQGIMERDRSFYCRDPLMIFFKLFVKIFKSRFKDQHIGYLLEMVGDTNWNFCEDVLRKTASIGSSAVKLSGEQSSPKTEFDEDKSEDIIFFQKFFSAGVPKTCRQLKNLNSIISNYFDASMWKKETLEIFRRAYQITAGSILKFIPAKDATLYYRYLAANDCSKEYGRLVADPASAFYKIFHGNRWIGYVTILSVMTYDGKKAVLVDVINLRNRSVALSCDFLDCVINQITALLTDSGFTCIMIPATPEILSSSVTEDIYRKYSADYIIKGELLLNNGHGYRSPYEDKDFLSLKSDGYLVVRDLTVDPDQGTLF